jgi:hypothetical protein
VRSDGKLRFTQERPRHCQTSMESESAPTRGSGPSTSAGPVPPVGRPSASHAPSAPTNAGSPRWPTLARCRSAPAPIATPDDVPG